MSGLNLDIPKHYGYGQEWEQKGFLDILTRLLTPSQRGSSSPAEHFMELLRQEREARIAAVGTDGNPVYLLPGDDPRPHLEGGRPIEYPPGLVPPLAAALLQATGGRPTPVPLSNLSASPIAGGPLGEPTLENSLRLLFSTGERPPPGAAGSQPSVSVPPSAPDTELLALRLYRQLLGDTAYYGNTPPPWPWGR